MPRPITTIRHRQPENAEHRTFCSSGQHIRRAKAGGNNGETANIAAKTSKTCHQSSDSIRLLYCVLLNRMSHALIANAPHRARWRLPCAPRGREWRPPVFQFRQAAENRFYGRDDVPEFVHRHRDFLPAM